ncbi:hypothetical protein EXS70_00770 [Candidatus Peribacteria bacterium]|nr:hypothetical protein [Candidatus Peribacteria bacterium]
MHTITRGAVIALLLGLAAMTGSQPVFASTLCESEIFTGPFSDVPCGHARTNAVAYVKEKGLVSGYADGTFKLSSSINRAEFTKLIVKAFYSEQEADQCLSRQNLSVGTSGEKWLFNDVKASVWYAKYVCLAKEKGLITGYPSGEFKPAQNIAFSESAKILAKAWKLSGSERDGSPWYKSYVDALAQQKSIPLTITSFSKLVDRGEAAEMIARLHAKDTSKTSLTYSQIIDMERDLIGFYISTMGTVDFWEWYTEGEYGIITSPATEGLDRMAMLSIPRLIAALDEPVDPKYPARGTAIVNTLLDIMHNEEVQRITGGNTPTLMLYSCEREDYEATKPTCLQWRNGQKPEFVIEVDNDVWNRWYQKYWGTSQKHTVKVFLTMPEDTGAKGKMIGCNDILVSVDREVPNTKAMLQASIEALLSLPITYNADGLPSPFFGNSQMYNALYQSKLQLQKATIVNGTANIYLTGELMTGGVCDDPRVIAQVEETARQFPTVQRVQTWINGQALESYFSGQ